MNYILYSLLVVFLAYSTESLASEEKIKIATNRDSSPGWSINSKENGFVMHVISAAFKESGVRIDIEWYSSWARAFSDSKTGKVDSSCCWFYVKKRTKDFYYSDPVVSETQVFFHLKSFKFNWSTINDLKGIKIGGNTGFHYGNEFQLAELENRINIERTKSYEQNFKKLYTGRIQIYPVAPITAYEQLRNIYHPKIVSKFTYHPKPVQQKFLHLVISKKVKEKRAKRLLHLFNIGLQNMKENGTYSKILQDAELGVYKKRERESKEPNDLLNN